MSLLSLWEDYETAIVVDATQSGAEPGTVRRLPVHDEPLPEELRRTSTHLLGVAEAVELARALGKLPARTIVYGIEGGSWDTGAGAHARGGGGGGRRRRVDPPRARERGLMHERALLADLVREIESVVAREGATSVRSVRSGSGRCRT